MIIERRLLRNVDFLLILATLALMVYGIFVLASATREPLDGLASIKAWTNPGAFSYVQRQIIWGAAGIVFMVAMTLFDYRALRRWWHLLYGGSLALLILLLILPRGTASTAQRWIALGPFALQPAEFAKLSLILALAAVLSGKKGGIRSWFDLLPAAGLLALPAALVVLQPDLGTALVFTAVFFGMVWMAGFPVRRYLMLVGGFLAVAVGALVARIQFDLPIPIKRYQVRRLIVFLDPHAYATDEGYQIIQSMFAIGSGQLHGKGLFRGDQSQLDYVSEHHTDFIFSVLGEELGFVGGIIFLLLFTFLLWRAVQAVALAKDGFGSLLAAGVVALLAFHLVINVGMTMSVMPVTGLPLPFISYGGSAMMVNCAAIGLLLNVRMRRHKIQF